MEYPGRLRQEASTNATTFRIRYWCHRTDIEAALCLFVCYRHTVRRFKLPLEGVAAALNLAYSRRASRLSFECWEVSQLTRIRAFLKEFERKSEQT